MSDEEVQRQPSVIIVIIGPQALHIAYTVLYCYCAKLNCNYTIQYNYCNWTTPEYSLTCDCYTVLIFNCTFLSCTQGTMHGNVMYCAILIHHCE